MIKHIIICLTALCLVVGMTTAYPTADALASAPVNEGYSIADTAAIVSTWQQAGWDRFSRFSLRRVLPSGGCQIGGCRDSPTLDAG